MKMRSNELRENISGEHHRDASDIYGEGNLPLSFTNVYFVRLISTSMKYQRRVLARMFDQNIVLRIDILQYVSTEYPIDKVVSDIGLTRKTNKGLSLTKQNILLKNDST